MDGDPAQGAGGGCLEALDPAGTTGSATEALDKILANPEPPGYQVAHPRPKPKLGPFLGVIDEILEADKGAPPKQRHTARRIFERLRDEHGYTGGITQVQGAVAQAKQHSKEVFVPLSATRRATPSSTSARRPSRSPGCGARPTWR